MILTNVNNLEVTCYSGYTYAERPVSFRWRGMEYHVDRVEKEWLEPKKKCFRVRTEGNEVFQLCYNQRYQQWSLTEPGEE